MNWKGLKEENQMKICTEKCAYTHRFLCMRCGMVKNVFYPDGILIRRRTLAD
jgi:hypothetical protein